MMVRLLTTHLANDWRDIFPTIKVPTMILMGGKSYFASQLLWNWMKETIKGSKLEVIEEGGHDYYIFHPEVFNRLVKRYFLDKD